MILYRVTVCAYFICFSICLLGAAFLVILCLLLENNHPLYPSAITKHVWLITILQTAILPISKIGDRLQMLNFLCTWADMDDNQSLICIDFTVYLSYKGMPILYLYLFQKNLLACVLFIPSQLLLPRPLGPWLWFLALYYTSIPIRSIWTWMLYISIHIKADEN